MVRPLRARYNLGSLPWSQMNQQTRLLWNDRLVATIRARNHKVARAPSLSFSPKQPMHKMAQAKVPTMSTPALYIAFGSMSSLYNIFITRTEVTRAIRKRSARTSHWFILNLRSLISILIEKSPLENLFTLYYKSVVK